jgi:hypothetical protein
MAVEERIDGPTLAGGDYSIALFSRDGEPTDKAAATDIEIIEYAADGREIQRTYGALPAKS